MNPPVGASHRTLHILLTLTSLHIVLLSINRLSSLTLVFVAPNEFLRWTDLNNMVLGLVAVLLYYLLARHIHDVSAVPTTTAHRALGAAFVVGAYLYASSYGNHEVTNYLNIRFCQDNTSDICRIISFNDDEFSHYLFFIGFIVLTVVVMLTNAVSPDARPHTVPDMVLVTINALFVGAGVVANLAFEEIGFDLYVVAVVAVLAVVLLWRQPRQLVLRYYAITYVLGLGVTLLVTAVNG